MNGKKVRVTKYKDGSWEETEAFVADEISIRIMANGLLYGTLTCSPWNLEELAVGYLCLEGAIHSYADVLTVKTRADQVDVICRPELQKDPRKDPQEEPDKEPPAELLASDITRLMRELEQRSEIFHQTGGVHNAALSDGKNIITNTEDVSRHNALNRLVGRCLMQGISLQNKVIVFSGRVPEEIIQMAARMRCSAIISVSAPTSKAIEIAQQHDVMLISFARGEQFNVYTCRDKLSTQPGNRGS